MSVMSNMNFLKVLLPQAVITIIVMMMQLEAANASCIEKEREALVKMKKAFVDDYGMLSSWGSSPDCCQWDRVLCHPQTGHVEKLLLHGDPELQQGLRGEISSSLMDLPSLHHLDLSSNDFNATAIPIFLGSLTKLAYLGLNNSAFGGTIPVELANLSSLQELHLGLNHIVGTIPTQLGNLSNLQILSVGDNYGLKVDGIEWLSHFGHLTKLDLRYVSNLNYSNNLFPVIGKLPNLKELWLSGCHLTDNNILSTPPSKLKFSTILSTLVIYSNKLTSSVFPWIFNLSSSANLATLDLSYNRLGGPLPNDFGKSMNSLVELYFFGNELNGTISEVHFGNLTKLLGLGMTDNFLSLKFSENWIPPFQLHTLWLSNCKLGPGFPTWLRSQNNLHVLHISDAEINDFIPEWFWRLLQGANALQIRIHSNNLTGIIPDLPLEYAIPYLSLASNQVEGHVPSFLLQGGSLDISGNQFSKFDFSCDKGRSPNVESLGALDLSNNNLSGELPDCWDHFKSLKILDLSNNQLSGRIPNSMGSLSQLVQLVLRNNCFSGTLPSLKNASQLEMLDLENNDLSGPIPPSWTKDNLKQLETLSLRMNKLDGNLPIHLCFLTKLRVLDLSFNKFTGAIPACLDKLVAMVQKHVMNDSTYLNTMYFKGEVISSGHFFWNLPMVWKGREVMYNDHYGLLSIDLSHNQLEGEMPTVIRKLTGLRFLNLSSNKLSGKIISEIGKLKSLESLDLSRNHFHGEIPPSLAEISLLSTLDLSNNNLSGEIPSGTQLQSFDPSSYEGNPNLCGRPLRKLCPSEDHPLKNGTQANQLADEDDGESFMKAFYESLGVGFGVGFWIVFGSLLAIRSWRHAYFKFVSHLSDSIYVTTMLLVARWRRWLHN